MNTGMTMITIFDGNKEKQLSTIGEMYKSVKHEAKSLNAFSDLVRNSVKLKPICKSGRLGFYDAEVVAKSVTEYHKRVAESRVKRMEIINDKKHGGEAKQKPATNQPATGLVATQDDVIEIMSGMDAMMVKLDDACQERSYLQEQLDRIIDALNEAGFQVPEEPGSGPLPKDGQ